MKLVLHPRVVLSLARLEKVRTGSFLFYGPRGVGKSTAALQLADSLGCNRSGGLFKVEPDEKSKSGKIAISQVRSLQEELSLTNYYADKSRLILIDPADKLTVEAQNALLKTLEEPPRNSVIVLIASDIDLLLPTVRSRVQSIFFPPVLDSEIEKLVGDKIIAKLSRGRMGVANNLKANETQLARLKQIAGLVGNVIRASLFDRMILVPEILDTDDGSQFLEFLAAAVGKNLRESKAQANDLSQIEQTRRYIAANVPPKTALESLMLELSC